MIGTTTDSYNAALAQAATYLGGLGETTAQVSDVALLWSFLVSQADAEFPTTTLTSAVDASLSRPATCPWPSTGPSCRRLPAAPRRASSAWAGRLPGKLR